MIYKKFYFENYKGIKDKLEFPVNVDSKKPYCIIGNNEGGKTTILKGMAFISRLCRDEFDCNDIINKKEIDKIHKNNLIFYLTIIIFILYSLQRCQQQHYCKWSFMASWLERHTQQ